MREKNNINKTRIENMTNAQRMEKLKKAVGKYGFGVKFAGYTQSKRGNEVIFNITTDCGKVQKEDGSGVLKGTIRELQNWINKVDN